MWGDCGAFAYVEEHEPPYMLMRSLTFTLMEDPPMVAQLIIIFEYQETEFDFAFDDSEVRRRQKITLSMRQNLSPSPVIALAIVLHQ